MSNENIELRSKILSQALYTENGVNGLLVGHLGIFDREKTKNFGNKAGISFKSKIDLLLDLDILTKEEHFNLDLQMIFRNKFLHDLDFNSFEYAVKNVDKSVIKKLEKFIEDPEEKDIEEKYGTAYFHLYGFNAKMLHKKFEKRRKDITARKELIDALTTSFETSIDLSSKFAEDINLIMLDCELFHPQVIDLQKKVLKCCQDFVDNMKTNDILERNREILEKTNRNTLKDLLK